jgi:hypothetical protein
MFSSVPIGLPAGTSPPLPAEIQVQEPIYAIFVLNYQPEHQKRTASVERVEEYLKSNQGHLKVLNPPKKIAAIR